MPAQTQVPGLFRDEAVESRRDLWLGEARLIQPISVRLASIVCVVMVTAIILFALCGTYTRRVYAQGVLAPNIGLIAIASPSAGRVRTSGVTEGVKVRKGDLLFSIDTDFVSSNGPTQKRVIDELGKQKESIKRQRDIVAATAVLEKTALQDELANVAKRRDSYERQISLQAGLTEALRTRAAQLQKALAAGIAIASDYNNQNYLFIQANALLAQLQQDALQIDGKASEIKSHLAQFDPKLARQFAEMDRAIAQLDQQIADGESRQQIEVRAPEDGTLTSIRVHAGQQVSIGTPLLTLLPGAGHLQANLFVDSSAIGFIAAGEAVMLRYAAFPFQRFGLHRGRVAEVTRAPVTSDDASRLGPPGSANEGLYRIIVEPERQQIDANGGERRLEAGMRVEADIALERRSLMSWLLDPLGHLRRSTELVAGGRTS